MSVTTTALEGVGASAPTPAVDLASITKHYGRVVACDDVDLQLHAGRIHGILGENGAGKTTLMKILIGLVQPDHGTITLAGRETVIHDPQTAADLGIGMVHQHLSLVDSLTVWENVLLGDHARFDRRRAREQVAETAEHYGLGIDPDRRVGDLSAGLRQRVELIKCLRRDPAILILDEPTSVLTPAESEQLFTTLREVIARERRAVALVSHKLAEVLHATDEITIMRHGRVVDRLSTADASAAALARAMVGREVSLRTSAAALGAITLTETGELDAQETEPPTVDTPVVDATDVEVPDTKAMLIVRDARVVRDGVAVLDQLSVEVHAGEIVGVAGVEGNGQRPLGDLMSSLIHLDGGTRHHRRRHRRHSPRRLHGAPWRGRDPRGSPRLGMRARHDDRREPAHRSARFRCPLRIRQQGSPAPACRGADGRVRDPGRRPRCPDAEPVGWQPTARRAGS